MPSMTGSILGSIRSWRMPPTIDEAYRSWRDDRTIRLGAGLAYYALFGIVPFVALAVYIASLAFSRNQVRVFIFEGLARILGEADAEAVATSVSSAVAGWSSDGSLGLIGLGALVFSSSLLFAALQDALNVIFGIPVEAGIRRSVRRRLSLFALVLIFASLVLAALLLQTIVSALLSVFGLGDLSFTDVPFKLLSRLVSLVVIALGLAVLYRAMPRTAVSWKAALMGACVAVAAGSIAVVVVRAYLDRFATSSIGGATGGVALVLTLIYVLSQVVLAGAQLTKVLNERP